MKKLLFILTCLFLFISCEQDRAQEFENLKGKMDFTYRGVHYSSSYVIENGKEIWDDDSVRGVLAALKEMPELATLVKSDGAIEYYDRAEDIITNAKSPQLRTQEKRDTIEAVTLGLYENENKNKSKNAKMYYSETTIDNDKQGSVLWYASDLHSDKNDLDKQVSSISMSIQIRSYIYGGSGSERPSPGRSTSERPGLKRGAVVVQPPKYPKRIVQFYFYDGKDLNGKALVFERFSSEDHPTVFDNRNGVNLKSYGWNDRIRSFKVHIW